MLPTPYPAINTLLQRLLAGARAVLQEQFTGLYLHGSLAGGDFDPPRSDIDFLVVTEGELADEPFTALQEMHARLTATALPWAERLEGSYIPRRDLRRFIPGRSAYPALRYDGSFGRDNHGSDWVLQRHILRTKGIALSGPPPAALIDPISPEEIRGAVRGILREWWRPMLADHYRLPEREYQAYAVLTMARSLYTFEHGDTASKLVAARWAQAGLGQPWPALIEEALAWPAPPQPDRLAETLAFIRFTLDRVGEER